MFIILKICYFFQHYDSLVLTRQNPQTGQEDQQSEGKQARNNQAEFNPTSGYSRCQRQGFQYLGQSPESNDLFWLGLISTEVLYSSWVWIPKECYSHTEQHRASKELLAWRPEDHYCSTGVCRALGKRRWKCIAPGMGAEASWPGQLPPLPYI